MSQRFQAGDFLVFQLEAGFALLRIIAVDDRTAEKVWHVAVYNDFFLDVETAEAATGDPAGLAVSSPHIALTNRAFESTQVAKISNAPLTPGETAAFSAWLNSPDREVSDRSVRLMLGIR